MRKSLQDIQTMIVPNKPYAGDIPVHLLEYHYYLKDQGHVIMCVPDQYKHLNDPDMYEVGIPVKYVLANDFVMENGYIYISVPYNEMTGTEIDDSFYEF